MTTAQTGRTQWRLFWIFYLTGLSAFAYIAATNTAFVTEVSPGGILDHQSAGVGAVADRIHAAWKEKGSFGFAKVSMSLDLVFITFQTLAGVTAGYLIARKGGVKGMLGWTILGVWLVFGACDYIETTCQLVQVLQDRGSDELAGLAASVKPVKVAAFLGGTLLLWAGLIWTGIAGRKAPPAV
ncbi:MAG: hypothetical protein IV086_08585 [Hyphomonadaceae bacterium]|nr:MAG: hypothetical protein FD160_402 [Caulobacteraceae bacterium]MBT9445740.1 hypothetical protein [Hyphomonadaceae bacterium]TPW07268.1 MAG: hypothetical protein FD124_1289 [Alphaproteobacteria bacterium]